MYTKVTVLALSIVSLAAWGMSSPKKPSPVESADSVWIVRSDGAQSCEPKSGMSVEQGAEELRHAQVHVLDSRKANDKKMHIQVCGAPTGTTNSYLIPKSDLGQALALGYREAK